MGSAFSGLLAGFVETSLALQKRDEDKAQKDAELDIRKQDLDLKRTILKGEQASRDLQDQVHRQTIQDYLIKYGRQQDAAKLLNNAATGATSPTPAAPTTPMLDLGRTLATGTPGDAASVPPAPEGTSYLQRNVQPTLPTGIGPNVDPSTLTRLPASPGATLFNRIAANVGAAEGIHPNVVRLYQTAVLPQETRDYNSQAVSPAGAEGLSQLMPRTAASVGVTEPLNPVQSIRGGLRYLQQLYTQFGGDVPKTLAAYNAGPGRVAQAGGVPNIPETQRYVTNGVAAYNAAPAPDSAPQVPGPGAPAPSAAPGTTPASPLVRQPVTVAASPELDALNGRLANLDALQQRIDAGLAQHPELRAQPDVKETLKNLQTQKSELEKQRQELTREQTPGDIYKGLLIQNKGDIAKTNEDYKQFKLEEARNQQKAGLEVVAQKTGEVETAKDAAKQRFKETQTLLDVNAQTSRQYFDTQTGKPLAQSTRYNDALERVGKSEVVFLDDQEAKGYRDIQKTVPLLQKIRAQIEAVYGPGGIFEQLTPEERLGASVSGGLARLTQSNPQLAELDRTLKGNVDNLRRNLQGQVGTQTEGDAQRGLAAITKVDGIPDSQVVAYGMYNTLLETVNGSLGTYLGNPYYQQHGLSPLGQARQVTGAPVAVSP